MKPERILIVDDESDICEILQFNLEAEGYEVEVASSAEEALKLIEKHHHFDLLLLDVMLEGMSGFELSCQLKQSSATAELPIIFCTAKDSEPDLLKGFSLGSDDYITKPFRLAELKARVKAVLRRTTAHQSQPTTDRKEISYKGLQLDSVRKLCYLDHQEIQLTKLEYELLALLISNRSKVYSREEILQSVWTPNTIVLDRTVDVTITRLRKKIGIYGNCIKSKFGYGYTFEEE